MSNARRLNNSMGAYVANQTIKQMNLKGVPVKDARILILGFTFKENCPDTRNTKVVDIYHTLREYTPNITIYDPWVKTTRKMWKMGSALRDRSMWLSLPSPTTVSAISTSVLLSPNQA